MLPTAPGEGPTKLQKQVELVMNDIAKHLKREAKRKGKSTDPKRSLALGRVAIGMLFSALGATSKEKFKKLDSETRHWLSMCVCMHAAAMRFQLLRKLRTSGSSVLRWSSAEQMYRMASDWRKMKSKGAFTLPFPRHPKHQALKYHWYDQAGIACGSFVAATILEWQCHAMKIHGEKMMFSPTGSSCPTQTQFQTWLRTAFKALLKLPEAETEALVAAMTPHSFRAGLASDLTREGVPRRTIMKHGRWASPKAMEQYNRDGLAQRISTCSYKRITDSAALHARAMAFAARLTRKRKAVAAANPVNKRRK